MILFSVAFISFVLSFFAVGHMIRFLNKRAILDLPNDRSSHETPTPRGGGLGILPIILVGMTASIAAGKIAWPAQQAWWAVITGMVLLGAVSWIDDRRDKGLPAYVRLAVQCVAVALPLVFWPLDAGRILPETFPVILERVLIGAAWIWFVNLYNFMDGINGITGIETASVSTGVIIVAGMTAIPGIGIVAGLLLGTSCGFLVWNLRKHAKIFLGDIGSITLGYLVAWLLILIAAKGYLLAALLLPLVYLVDATWTLVRRALQGKKIWQAHREHFYQQATRPGALTHKQACFGVLFANISLIFLAVCAINSPHHATLNSVIAFVIIVMLLRFFTGAGARAR